MNKIKKLLQRHFLIAIAATYNWTRRYRQLLSIQEGDIVLQVQHPKEDFGPWKVVEHCHYKDGYVLQSKEGKRIIVYREYVRKVDGPKTKAEW